MENPRPILLRNTQHILADYFDAELPGDGRHLDEGIGIYWVCLHIGGVEEKYLMSAHIR
jgi:hypothetical protein